MRLILSVRQPCKVLCFPWDIGFCWMCPLMYSLAGLVSRRVRNSARGYCRVVMAAAMEVLGSLF